VVARTAHLILRKRVGVIQGMGSPGRCFLRAIPLTPGHDPSILEISNSVRPAAEPWGVRPPRSLRFLSFLFCVALSAEKGPAEFPQHK